MNLSALETHLLGTSHGKSASAEQPRQTVNYKSLSVANMTQSTFIQESTVSQIKDGKRERPRKQQTSLLV